MKPRTVAFSIVLAAASLLAAAAHSAAQSNDDCMMCHSDKSLTKSRGGRSVSLYVNAAAFGKSAHGSASCVDCHQGLNPSDTPHARVIKPVDCLSCHEIAGFDRSVHGKPQGKAGPGAKAAGVAECKDCHGTHGILPKDDPKSPTSRGHLSATCGKCHEEEDRHYRLSAHGQALEKNLKGAPSCTDCHGEHNVERVDSTTSPVNKNHEARMCLKCHLDNPDVRNRVALSAGFIKSYEESVHGVAVARGNEKAASCSSCHGAHDMLKGGDANSKTHRWNIPATCGQCHEDVARTFNESAHGTALQWGNQDAPTCTDCHGEHQILGLGDPQSRVSATNVSIQTCGSCHSSVRLTRKYGMPEGRFQSFSDSYHGLASRGGDAEVANCASCHGVHNIKPSSDPTSTISKANLPKTCGQCHPGAGENFALGAVHVIESKEGSVVLYWVRLLYLGLIGTVVGGMFAHNALDFVKKSRFQFAVRSGQIPRKHHGVELFDRMNLSERLQHGVMMSSFIVLVVTGFMLRYPDSWWVNLLRGLSENLFDYRSIIHRIAGVAMIAVSLYHVYYLAATKPGRKLVTDLFPRVKDARDAIGNIAYNLGLSRNRVLFGRFCYIEKAEYWALVWGVVVMAATGLILWFDNFFLNRLTKLGWDVARAIHYYEAILATLAIVVWHFYFVIFNPNVYPMNTAWLTGKVTEEEMEDEHPLELEQIRAKEPGNAFETDED